jgi:hypothetical protein
MFFLEEEFVLYYDCQTYGYLDCCVEAKQYKKLYRAFSNTVTGPHAVMIHLKDASFTCTAMMNTRNLKSSTTFNSAKERL